MHDISICVITYNHEAYIEQTLNSILEQKTSYSFQVVIGEDCSTDNTRAICERFAANYPDKIKLLPSEKNLGAGANFVRTFNECDGKYLALLEGDDYWIYENKLQEQVDFLEANHDYILCAGKSGYVNYDGSLFFRDERVNKQQVDFTTEDYLKKMCFETAGILFNKTDFKLHDSHISAFSGDQFIVLLLTMNGKKIRYIDKNLSVYRYHAGGITKKLNKAEMITKIFYMLDEFDRTSGYKFHNHVELRKKITLIKWNCSILNYPKRLVFMFSNLGIALRYRNYIPFTFKLFVRYLVPFKF